MPGEKDGRPVMNSIGWLSRQWAENLRHNRVLHDLFIFTPGLSAFSDTPFSTVDLAADISLEALSLSLARADLYRPFNEAFDVHRPGAAFAIRDFAAQPPSLGRIDRGLIPLLGTEACGVHLNGLVRKPEGLFLWVGRRSADKRLDPGKLDHLVAGGMSAGLTPWQTLMKEGAEEAGLPLALLENAEYASQICYTMERPEGLRRDRLFCFDLFLPEAFQPQPIDGEVESFHLLPIEEVFTLVRDTEAFKFNVSLVLIDLFLRLELFSQDDAATLAAALYPEPASLSPEQP
ncbi:NUDIX domain-containing protein [Oecophyllibacter saccharovorans]|nr:NUDIX domain-containing protein [Oecophyllibacter saccharovorans]